MSEYSNYYPFRTSSASESGPPEYNRDQTECTQVITEQPSQPNRSLFLSTPENDNDQESVDNMAVVEQALSSTHIYEAISFTLKYHQKKGFTCCPSLSIIPKLTPHAQEAVEWKIKGSCDDKCHCCCCFPPFSIYGIRKWQTMTLKQNEHEILHFLFSPIVCCFRGRKDRLVDIYIPQRNTRIGFLREGNSNSNGMVVTDCMSKLVFSLKQVEVTNCELGLTTFAIKVLDAQGTQIAIAQPKISTTCRGWTTWTDFELKFNTNVPSNLLPVSSKAVIVVAFAIWVINYKGEKFRSMVLLILSSIVFTILLVVITVLYDSFFIK